MILYLLRHGDSEARAATDAQRQLTTVGRREVRNVARRFADRGIHLDHCFSSPYLRAEQTSAAFLAELPGSPAVEYNDVLTPEKRAFEVMQFLEQFHDEHILLVSHNPLLSELNAVLVEGDISSMMILGTCDLVAIEVSVLGNGLGHRRFYLSQED